MSRGRGAGGSRNGFLLVLITVLDLTFPLGQLLKVSYDGLGRQMMKRLVPQVALVVVPALSFPEQLLDVESNFPLHWMIAPQTPDHRLTHGGRLRGRAPGPRGLLRRELLFRFEGEARVEAIYQRRMRTTMTYAVQTLVRYYSIYFDVL